MRSRAIRGASTPRTWIKTRTCQWTIRRHGVGGIRQLPTSGSIWGSGGGKRSRFDQQARARSSSEATLTEVQGHETIATAFSTSGNDTTTGRDQEIRGEHQLHHGNDSHIR